MAGVIEYDLEGSRLVANLDGERWDRRYIIRGLESGPSVPALIGEAFALIPDYGTPAPAPMVNLFVREATIDQIWCENQAGTLWSANGTVTYTTPARVGGGLGVPDDDGPGVTLSSTSSSEEIETDLDRAGNQITTTYDNLVQAHSARTFRTGRNLQFGRVEVSSPKSRQDTHEGTLNAASWNGYAAETVLCQSIDYFTDAQGGSYTVTYTFQVKPDGWKFRAVHEDPLFPGHPLPNAGQPGLEPAVAEVDILPTSNFNALNIVLT